MKKAISARAQIHNSMFRDFLSGRELRADTFIGDYFGNVFNGTVDYATFVSTYGSGDNPQHYQQQVVSAVTIP